MATSPNTPINPNTLSAVSPITLGLALNSPVQYLTKQEDAWYILAKAYMPSTQSTLNQQWSQHPSSYHELKVFGKTCHENRYSQQWSTQDNFAYNYSGSSAISKSYFQPEGLMVKNLIRTCNDLIGKNVYNGCLQNWYEQEHTIGLHSDDEKQMNSEYPIFSLSQGGTRRFLFRPKNECVKSDLTFEKMVEIYLEDGDFLVMGGKCQEVTKHEIPKWRKTMDPGTGRRVNWTVRAFHGITKNATGGSGSVRTNDERSGDDAIRVLACDGNKNRSNEDNAPKRKRQIIIREEFI